MAYAHSRFGYVQTQPDATTINSKRPAFYDEDEGAILDPSVLDVDIMHSPEEAQIRKGSFANSNGVLSPAESQGWEQQHYVNGLPVEPVSAGPSHPFHEEHAGYIRPGAPHVSGFGHPPQQPHWAFEHGSGHCTPTTGVDFIPPPPPQQFDNQHYGHHRADSAHGSFSRPGPPSHQPPPQQFNVPFVEPGYIPAPQVQTPMSPHSHQDWMTMAQQEVEGRPMTKRMRQGSPARTAVDLQRRDGIRKKNGRIDIPHERNIQTIDDMIDQTHDEDLLKELKQQKRLLRNREAALASRQRKKKHTEDLETREKDFNKAISDLQHTIEQLQLECSSKDQNYQILAHRYQESCRHNEILQEEKRDMMMRHTEETSNLRRKIQLQTEHMELGSVAMSAVPSSNGYTDFNAEMEALTMGTQDFDYFFTNDLQNESSDEFAFDSKPDPVRHSPVLGKKSSSSTMVPSPPKKSSDGSTDQPVASGLLFFLLLCGAFVASKPASSQPADLPAVPREVRAVAPTVLNNLLSDNSAPSAQASNARTAHSTGPGAEPAPSGLPHPSTTRSRSSRLDQVHHRITSPTKQQEIDSAFALTTAQYASLTNIDFAPHGESSSRRQDSQPRRNLAEVLANMQDEHARNSKAEVYTRSLLWDQIPSDVVRQFKEMVADHNELEARERTVQYHDNDDDIFKVES